MGPPNTSRALHLAELLALEIREQLLDHPGVGQLHPVGELVSQDIPFHVQDLDG
jgi:hypothetical protein